jgi:hypothetical protein
MGISLRRRRREGDIDGGGTTEITEDTESSECARFAAFIFRGLHPSATRACFVFKIVTPRKFSPAPEYLARLEQEIRKAHGLCAHHEATWMGVEQNESGLWSGSVEVFRLKEPAPARRVFAWSHVRGRRLECYVVVEKPGIDTPQAAVRETMREGEGELLAG